MSLFGNLANAYIEKKLGPDPEKEAMNLSNSYLDIDKFVQEAKKEQSGMYKLYDESNPTIPKQRDFSELEQWKMNIDAMMKTNNPSLQKEALEQINQYRQTATTPTSEPTDGRTSAQKEMAAAIEDGSFTGGMGDWKAFNKVKPYQDAMDMPLGLDARDVQVPDGKGGMRQARYSETPRMIEKMGGTFRKSLNKNEAGGLAMMETAMKQFPIINKLAYNEDGGINRGVLNLVAGLSLDPTQSSAIAKGINSFTGTYSAEEMSKAKRLKNSLEIGVKAITRNETGAAMASEEMAHTESRFMPSFGEDDALTIQKLKAFEYFIRTARDLMSPEARTTSSDSIYAAEVKRLADEALLKFDIKDSDNTPGYDQNLSEEENGYTPVKLD
jgi:hypothetical protein